VIIKEETVAEIVAEASKKMSDPNYSAVLVGGFVQTQDPTAKYLSAHERELGGAEGVVNAIFHAALIGLCFQRANNRTVRTLTYEDLNHVSGMEREVTLQKRQPAILEYLKQNVEAREMRYVLMLVTLAMDWAS